MLSLLPMKESRGNEASKLRGRMSNVSASRFHQFTFQVCQICADVIRLEPMPSITRRNALRTGIALAIPPGMLALLTGCNQPSTESSQKTESSDGMNQETQASNPLTKGEPMKVQYLEIVTPKVDALCQQYSTAHGVTFSEPEANFGGARTAELSGGGKIGIRGPLRDTETPVVRPYMLVDDIKAAVESAAEAGAEVAMPPMEIPDHGMFAIVIHGGIECGFWQN